MLKPINAQTQAPLGIFDLCASTSVEGGYVGYLKADGYGMCVAIPGSSQLTAEGNYVVGLIDDSSTGSGYSTLFGSVLPRAAASSILGPNTIVGSGKCTLWTQAGLYVTDQITGVIEGTSENFLLYVSNTTGKLKIAASDDAVGRYLVTTGANSGLLEALVSPQATGGVHGVNDLYLIYFFGQVQNVA